MGEICGAHTVAVGDRGEPLDVAAQKSREHFGLGFAQLRELFGHVADRAMVLTQLFAAGGRFDRGRIAIDAECIGEDARAIGGFGLVDKGAIALLEGRDALAGESHHGVFSSGLGEEPQCVGGKIVIRLVEPVATKFGDEEHLGRAASAAATVDALLARLDDTVRKKQIEVPAHGRGGEVKSACKIDRSRSPLFEDALGDAVTGRGVVQDRRVIDPIVFHNTIVPLMLGAFNEGSPKSLPGRR